MALKYKVVSYISSTDTQPYIHGYYDTEDAANRVRDNYNTMWANHKKLYAKVEEVK